MLAARFGLRVRRERGFALFFKTRNTVPALALMAAAVVFGLIIGEATFHLPEQALELPWNILLPLVSACAVSMSTRTPMADLEKGAVRPIRLLRAAHLALLLGAAFSGELIATLRLAEPYSYLSAERNLATLIGLGLLGARLLGGRLAWLPPAAATMATLVAGAQAGIVRKWAVLLQPDPDVPSRYIAGLLLTAGCIAVMLGGTREANGEIG